jgi:hypothetical protein
MTSSSPNLGDQTQAAWDIPKNDAHAILFIVLLPLVFSLPSLLGWCSSDPIHFVTQITSFHGKQIVGGYPWIDPTVGTYAEALGKLSADEWLSGKIPWWNYYSGVGMPLAAEMSPGAFFLPFVLLNHFTHGLLYIEVIVRILAGLGTYYLLRKIGLVRLAAVTGATLYEFSGVFVWLGTPVTSPIAFLPWLILGIECSREASLNRHPTGWLIVATSLAFSIYGGFPENAYIDGLLAGVWSCWRLFSLPSEVRFRFIRKLATGVVVGLLLSAPVIIPFVEYVGRSYLGGHNFNGGFGGLRKESFPQLFFPSLYGTPWSYVDDSNVTNALWANIGGYLSAVQVTVIVEGLVTGRRSALFLVLLLWILVCLGRTFALPFVSSLVDLIPLLKLVAFYRYAPPSWEFCTAVLCAIVVNDLNSGGFHSRIKLLVGLLAALSIVTISVYPALGLLARLYPQGRYSVFLWSSLAWGFGTVSIVAVAFWFGKVRYTVAARAVAIILAVDAVVLFSVPSFSGTIGGESWSAGVNYLKRHIGTYRFYTLGPITPNWGAYYRIASINHNSLPIAANWVDYIRDHIDPYANPVCFTGSFARDDPKAPTQAEVLRENIAQYEAIGVRYIVSFHSQNPFERIFGPAILDSGNKPLNLNNEQSVSGKIYSSQLVGNKIVAVRILIGNYSGKSDGRLKVRLSAGESSVSGERDLQESENNQPFYISLDQPMSLATGEIGYEISHSGGTFPVALWIWPQKEGQQTHSSSTIPPGYAPKLDLVQAPQLGEEAPQRVFESSDMDIYELSGVRPYFELAGGHGDLTAENREAVSVNPSSESQLVRRELYYPGWVAYANGKKLHIESYNGIFQTVRIPPGQYKIVFTYLPTHIGAIAASFLLGVLWLIVGAISSRALVRKHDPSNPPSAKAASGRNSGLRQTST